ncbi:hypothetical protein J2Z62_000424 [Mycoplasmoides fastidiosum]|uniref:ATP-binding protein n=1 Tax=Mycoplasmoides fastidiosum TaxID=92758 RepID=A0ABU0LZ46_9BACT|nr:ATP-binding protein [Mycoplasmoides fastidiosum]MDQ0513986.1 hypothetical protein [Mycoplasmoides fastidiosum]UUD37600.1 ATP-binding protein [Mycoplasmoides fastidiosum]
MNNEGFKIEFDKNTIDHLGIKLYSSFLPVIAELISNSYDADAENIVISIDYNNKIVTIKDNGIGMNHDELNRNFLVIGKNRRLTEKNGLSLIKKRKITGKKGLGKLAVFGVAKTVEVISVKEGIKNAFIINYDDLKAEISNHYRPKIIFENQSTNESSGTTIIIKEIKQNSIMSIEDLAKSLSRRFTFYDNDFEIKILNENNNVEILVNKSLYFDSLEKQFEWKFPADFSNEIISSVELKRLNEQKVTGKIYTKRTPLMKKDSGFVLYVRNKLASENVFFNDRANDRFNSYVTGFFNIDFIDDSNENDYISTTRQSILWEENEITLQLKNDLNKLISKISESWRKNRKKEKEDQLKLDDSFFNGLNQAEINSIKKVKDTLLNNSAEIDDIESIKRVLEGVRNAFKFESFQKYIYNLKDEEITVDTIEKITSDWEYIEAKELAQVAVGRIRAIEQFEKFVHENASESKIIQPFLEKFPWILDPRITTFKRETTYRKLLKENFPEKKIRRKK